MTALSIVRRSTIGMALLAAACAAGPTPARDDGQTGVLFHAEDGYLGLDTYDVVRQHLVSHHLHFGEGREARLFRSQHRYIWPAELDLMAQLAGFELESRHADWVGSEFTAESRSHVSAYRIPPEPERPVL